ncbi:MAG: choice-of-anchor D domain-containing protein [Verrucomicrobia bacterium]|nr:choice-of-anchor D domain-containing protein [Verrucomicrobiota bacterium]
MHRSATLVARLLRRPGAALALAGLLCGTAALLPEVARAADGALDPTFQTDLLPSSVGRTVLNQPDGKILLLGNFQTTTSGGSFVSSERMLRDGARDASFTPPTVSGFVCGVLQDDGRILVGGSFASINGVAQRSVARLLADGSLDPTFVPPPFLRDTFNGLVSGIARQPDGKVLVVGAFNLVGGVPRNRMARLNADGSLDPTFAPVFANSPLNPAVSSLTLQPDGRILVTGLFNSVNGVPRSNFARLNADGSLDALTADTDGLVVMAMPQPDGGLVLAGSFGQVQGVARSLLARLTPAGSVDPGFQVPALPNVAEIAALVQQVDGRLLVAGQGPSGGPGAYVRLNADGSLDPTFGQDPALQSQSSDFSYALTQQADGRLLVARQVEEGDLPAQVRSPLVRLLNAGGTQSVTVEPTRVRWLRAGALPEVTEVAVQLSTDGGATWSELGAAGRIAGGWELGGLSLPGSGIVRLAARPLQGLGGSSGRLGFQQAFHLSAAQIAVEQPVDRTLANGESRDFGRLSLGQTSQLTFTIHNYGSVNLGSLATTLSGPDAAQFAVVTAPASPVAPAGSTTFTVAFHARTAGAKNATLALANNTPGANPFVIQLTATAQPDGQGNPSLPAPSITPGNGEFIAGLSVQGDQKLVIGGRFASVGGYARSNVARYLAAGPVEAAFAPALQLSYATGAQPDGKLLVAQTDPSTFASRVVRLLADGSVDAGFASPGFDFAIYSLALQSDGKILVGGGFDQVNGAPRQRLVRLLANGALDLTFAPLTAPTLVGFVYALELQADGRILAGIWSGAGSGVLRLLPDGTLDPTFNVLLGPYPSPYVNCLVIQSDGRIVLGGDFTSVNGQPRHGLARLQADGSLDASFTPAADGQPLALAAQADGRVLVAGAFSQLAGAPRSRLGRLHADGSIDAGFLADAAGTRAEGLALTSRGQVVVSGDLQSIGGVTVPGVTLLHNTVGSTLLSVPNAGTVVWQRTGSVGETPWTLFELSTDQGSTWTTLGTGTRIPGGWKLSGLNLPAQAQIRASGVTRSGLQNGSFSCAQETVSYALTPSELLAWRSLQGLVATGAQDAANPSGDGVANLQKFAFNLAPNPGDLARASYVLLPSNGSAGLPAIGRDAASRLQVQFVRRRAAGNPGVVYLVQTSSDLQNWTIQDLSIASVTTLDATWERVTLTDPRSGARRFGRVLTLAIDP